MLNGDTFYSEKRDFAAEAVQNNRVLFMDHKDALKRANRTILSQYMAVMEEQRLNVLFQVLGIAFHELNQPLTSLLGNIELMLLNQDNPEKLKENIKRVEDAGKRFSSILRKIQNIRQGKSVIQDSRFCPMKTNKIWNVQCFIQDERVLGKIENLLADPGDSLPACTLNADTDCSCNIKEDTDLLILDEKILLSTADEGMIKKIRFLNNELPILAILRNKNERLAFSLIHQGVDNYCTLAELDSGNFLRMISDVKEKAWGRHQLKAALNDLAGVSIQDEQTGLFQRRFFKDALEREVTVVRRKETPCIACKLDLDGITGYCRSNNGGKEPAKALMDIVKVIQNSLGDRADLVCRYGNESFAFILSNTCAEEARRICLNLQSALERHFSGPMFLEAFPGVSMGMVLFARDQCLPAPELMKRLDEAADQAKNTGQSPVFFLD
jgi:two-component system cell cycle response regulator